MAKKTTFSLYLAKEDVVELDDLLTDSARDHIANGRATRWTSSTFGDGSLLYVFPSVRIRPKWLPMLQAEFGNDDVFGQSPCAVLLFKTGERSFAISFSYGHVYLDDSRTEADFGLKVAINFVSDAKLRGVERSNIGAAIRDVAQAAGQRDLRSFGFDDALDIIRKVSGYGPNSEFADIVTGSRCLRFSKKIELSAVPKTAQQAVNLFGSTAYKQTAFGVLDFLSPVLDPVHRDRLDELLVAAIRDDTDEFEISIPEILPDQIGTFRFVRAGIRNFYPDLSLELYRKGLGARLDQLAPDDLRLHRVAAYGDDERSAQTWPVYASLVGSLVWRGRRYALNEGFWYSVDDAFRSAADENFRGLLGPRDNRLRPFKKFYPMKEARHSTKPTYQSESSTMPKLPKSLAICCSIRSLWACPKCRVLALRCATS